MNSETTIRHHEQRGALVRQRLSESTEGQAEAIARHYIAHANIAENLLKMVEARKHTGGYGELDRAIKMLTDEIKNNHWNDFGIALEWSVNLTE